jgi:hypothetical protein
VLAMGLPLSGEGLEEWVVLGGIGDPAHAGGNGGLEVALL